MANIKTEEYPVIWLQGATCTGCSVSVLNSVSPTIKNVLVDEVIPGKHVNLRFQATVMAGAGELVIKALEETWKAKKGGYVLVMEGAIPTKGDGAYGSIGEDKEGKPVSIDSRVENLGRDALAVIALGTCASFGGIPAAKPNPSECVSVGQLFKSRNVTTPLINVPGCPPHPDWFVGTVASVLLNGLPKEGELDEWSRPRAFYGQLIHENCPRRAYYDEQKFAKKLSDPGCLYELGCKGPVTHADCPLRMWNNGVNWCVACGGLCIGCAAPGFPDLVSPMYAKTADITLPNIGQRVV
ncbi:MAG TPA: hydrogenase small subunit [Dehalococcoidia bacterium]|nr:hydrogenase small subunit [Dehalococcoidia bacterium]